MDAAAERHLLRTPPSWDREPFTYEPEIANGHLVILDRPGWGTEPHEEALRAPPGGLLNYSRKS